MASATASSGDLVYPWYSKMVATASQSDVMYLHGYKKRLPDKYFTDQIRVPQTKISFSFLFPSRRFTYPSNPHSTRAFCNRPPCAQAGTPLTALYEHIKQLALPSLIQVSNGG